MKKTINGSRYDTDTARLLHEHCTNITDSLDYTQERLYRTKSGNYFLHGDGGARTKYAGSSEDGWSKSGEKIIHMSADAARAWAEEHMDADECDAMFTAVDGDRVPRTIYLSLAAEQRLQELKASTGLTIPQITDKAIMAYKIP